MRIIGELELTYVSLFVEVIFVYFLGNWNNKVALDFGSYSLTLRMFETNNEQTVSCVLCYHKRFSGYLFSLKTHSWKTIKQTKTHLLLAVCLCTIQRHHFTSSLGNKSLLCWEFGVWPCPYAFPLQLSS